METAKKPAARYLQGALIAVCVICLIYCGIISWAFTDDVSRYQCYAVAFWQGWSGFQHLPSGQCKFITTPQEGQSSVYQQNLRTMQDWKLPSGLIQFVAAQQIGQPYYTLPFEYPLLVLVLFALGLIAPGHWYVLAFAFWMFLLAGCLYFVLLRWRSQQAAFAYLLYLVVGAGWMFGARFDLFPASLTLFALICTVKKRWNWAFALLALATLLKVYPAALLVPFVLTLQREIEGRWYVWRRWLPLAIFGGICLLVMAVSLLLNVAGTLAPLDYFIKRPIEMESLPASILWIASLLGKTSLTYVYSFDCNNVLSSASSTVTSLMTLLLVAGLLFTWWLQWQGRLDLPMSSLLTVLIVMVTAKVLSAQYIIWVIPLIAYVGQSNSRWLLFWLLVGLLTSWMFPLDIMLPFTFIASHILLWNLVAAMRNFLLVGFILVMLIAKTRKLSPFPHRVQHI